MSQFRIQAKHLFLTYPQCTIDKNDLLQHLQLKLHRWKPTYILVGREQHSDGHPHLHAYCRLSLKCDIREPTQLDCGGFHGNYQPARKPDRALSYCEKDGDTIEYGDRERDETTLGYGDIIASATTASEFTDLIIQHRPRDAVTNLERIQYFANYYYGKSGHIPYEPAYSSFITPTELDQWVDQAFTASIDRPVSLCLVGPSRLGKTEWARSLGTHMYFCGMINLDEWDDDAKYMVLDDFEWKFVPAKKQLIGAQKQIVLTDKYRKKKTVKWGKPVIYLCNPDQNPFNEMTLFEKHWYRQNFNEITVVNKLF